MLFLGAGISTPFGVPTMNEMVKKFELNLIAGSREEILYKDIARFLEEQFNRYDLETVISVLERITNLKKLQPFEEFLIYRSGKNIKSLIGSDDEDTSQKLMDNIKAFVFEQCKFDLEIYDNNKAIFQEILKMMADIDGGTSESYMCNTYTTNYDRYFDMFLKERFDNRYHISVKDYFDYSGLNNILVVPEEDFIQSSHPNTEYVKMHGSTDWYRDTKGRVVRTTEPFANYQPGIMMYPTNDKSLYLEPWIKFIMLFKRAVAQSNYLVVIGYSFNDEYIRNIFLENLNDATRKMAILNPSGAQIKEQFFSKYANVKGFDLKVEEISIYSHNVINWLKLGT
jgi:hypothetical protein